MEAFSCESWEVNSVVGAYYIEKQNLTTYVLYEVIARYISRQNLNTFSFENERFQQ